MTCKFCDRVLICVWCSTRLVLERGAYRDWKGEEACPKARGTKPLTHAPVHAEVHA